jgi:hypothetical protein
VLKNGNDHSLIAISSPLTPNIPINATARKSTEGADSKNVITIDEFLIRNNIPSATKYVIEQLDEL